MKKVIKFNEKAENELHKFELLVQKDFLGLITKLGRDGKLDFPDAKKLTKNLFEIRIKSNGVFRGFYGYVQSQFIIILHFFQKKTQKTPIKNLKLAQKRLKQYE